MANTIESKRNKIPARLDGSWWRLLSCSISNTVHCALSSLVHPFHTAPHTTHSDCRSRCANRSFSFSIKCTSVTFNLICCCASSKRFTLSMSLSLSLSFSIQHRWRFYYARCDLFCVFSISAAMQFCGFVNI